MDQYAFRRYLRSQGTRVGKGKHHKLPSSVKSPEAKAIIKAFKSAE